MKTKEELNKVELDNEETLLELENIKTELNKIIVQETRGQCIRARQSWYEESEKSTVYFFKNGET